MKKNMRMPTAEVVPIATARDKKGQPPAGFCPYPAFKDLSREEGDDLFRDLSGQNQESESNYYLFFAHTSTSYSVLHYKEVLK